MPSPVKSDFNDFPIKFSSLCWGEDVQISSTASDCSDKPKSPKSSRISKARVTKACKRCRLRKIKCNGGKPCLRCSEADEMCEYSYRWKKESKEYAQGYIEQILEQNDKYKRAMRLLYANRRLSIQPDNMMLPSTEEHDVPLVHDILDRLGLLDAKTETPSNDEGKTNRGEEKLEENGEPSSMASVSGLENESSMGDTISESIPSTDETLSNDYFGNFWSYGTLMQVEDMDLSVLDNDLAFPFPMDDFSSFQPLDIEQCIDLVGNTPMQNAEACISYPASFESPSMSDFTTGQFWTGDQQQYDHFQSCDTSFYA